MVALAQDRLGVHARLLGRPGDVLTRSRPRRMAGGRTHPRQDEAANEVTGIDGGEDTIAHDGAGDMLVSPQTAMPGQTPGMAGTFEGACDAWGRLAKVTRQGGGTVAEYRYDGLGRRIAKLVPNASDPAKWDRTDYYYSTDWQVLEERRDTGENDTQKEQPAGMILAQYVWDIRYVDAPILMDRNIDGNPGTGTRRWGQVFEDGVRESAGRPAWSRE